jgi:hypothetical protein
MTSLLTEGNLSERTARNEKEKRGESPGKKLKLILTTSGG